MADSIYLSRNTKMYVKTVAGMKQTSGAQIYEIPILDGFSVSQTDNTVEITASEATSVATATAGAMTNRGMKKLRTSKNPAEFSFQTYVRPYNSANSSSSDAYAGAHQAVQNDDTAIEMVLWALFAGATTIADDGDYKNSVSLSSGADTNTVVTHGATGTEIDLNQCKIPQARKDVEIVFEVAELGANKATTYTIDAAVLNEATVDFDIEGIATISWSGFGSGLTIANNQTKLTPTVSVPASAPGFIQNKVSSVAVDPNGSTGALNAGAAYSIVLTGGSITLTNNVTYITPDTLHGIDVPFTHQLGVLGITGNITCYLESGTDKSQELLSNLSARSVQAEDTAVNITVGASGGPRIQFLLDHCHLEVPTTNFEDVVSIDLPFTALGDGGAIDVPPAAKVKYIA